VPGPGGLLPDQIGVGLLGAEVAGQNGGLVWGLEFHDKSRAGLIAQRAFELGLLIETSGPESEVVKLLPALTITPDELDEGLSVLARAVRETA